VSRAGDRPQGKRSDWDRETTQHRAKTEARICFSQADYVDKVIAAAKALEADRLLLEGEVGRAAAWTCAACTPSFGCQTSRRA
jgi:hypothetical protein